MIDTLTLTAAVDEINDARLFDRPLPGARRRQLAAFLASRQGLPGSYRGLFSPVEGELKAGYRFYTGERINTNAGCRHILGEETLRALILLQSDSKAACAAVARAVQAANQMLHDSETQHGRPRGTFCCMRCSIALWRVLSQGAIDQSADRLRCGVKLLRDRRDTGGQWTGYPFHYTLSALLEAKNDEARAELRHARPAIDRRLARAAQTSSDACAARRRKLLELAAQNL